MPSINLATLTRTLACSLSLPHGYVQYVLNDIRGLRRESNTLAQNRLLIDCTILEVTDGTFLETESGSFLTAIR